MLSAFLEKVKSIFGLETERRKRRLVDEPVETPDSKIRRIDQPFRPSNFPTNMNPQSTSGMIRHDRSRRLLQGEHPELELCWERKNPGKENQFHWSMGAKESGENDVEEVDDDIKIWREVKPSRWNSDFVESRQNVGHVRQKVRSLSKDEVHLVDNEDEDVMFVKESSRQDVEEIFPSRLRSSLGPGRDSHHKWSAKQDISSVVDSSITKPYQKMEMFTNHASHTSMKPSYGLPRHAINPFTQLNPKKDTQNISRLDSPSVKYRIRSGNLSRAAILKQSLPPPPLYFGIEPKMSTKWSGLEYKIKKKPSAIDVSSSMDEMKAYNQMLQQFTSDNNSVSKMLSSGVECAGFKIFESQLKRNFSFNRLLNKRAKGVEDSHKIDTIDLSKSDDDVQEVEYLGGEHRASMKQKKQQSICKDLQEISHKAVKVDVKRTREVIPKTSGEAAQDVPTLPRSPPNVVEQMIKKSHVTDEEFIDDLMLRYSIEKSKISREMEMENMKKQIWTQRRQKFEGSLEDRLKKYVKITEVALDDVLESDEEEKLPELTSEMLDVVHDALRKNRSCVLARSGANTITGADIQTLADSNWLNDEVINNYMDMLIQRGQSKEYPSVYAFNTFFYPRLSSSGYSSVKRWTKKVDIFKQDMVLVPLHLEVHWALIVIDFRQKSICYYDSMNGRKNNILQLILKYLQEEKVDKKKENFDSSGWQAKLVQDIPQQRNGYDCGVFACMFAEHLARGTVKDASKIRNALKCNRYYPPFPFSQENMAYFRKRMIYEILTGKLLQ